jgi:hypothetical protein
VNAKEEVVHIDVAIRALDFLNGHPAGLDDFQRVNRKRLLLSYFKEVVFAHREFLVGDGFNAIQVNTRLFVGFTQSTFKIALSQFSMTLWKGPF